MYLSQEREEAGANDAFKDKLKMAKEASLTSMVRITVVLSRGDTDGRKDRVLQCQRWA